MRRYELMLVLRPDVADDKAQSIIDRTTRQIAGGDGQIVKVAPWGRRRLAYQIDRYREGSYHIVLFEAPAAVVRELARHLHINDEVRRHLVTRVGQQSADGLAGSVRLGRAGIRKRDDPAACDDVLA